MDKTTIITAAHCFEFRDVQNYTFYIMAGAIDKRSTQGQIIAIDKVVENQKQPYSRDTNEFDAIILKLKTPLEFNSNVQPACLPSISFNLTNLNCYVSGWGAFQKRLYRLAYFNMPDQLHWVRVPIVANDQCKATYDKYEIPKSYPSLKITENMICAGKEGKDTCRGDSGGPLVCSNQENQQEAILVGIVSFGFMCGEELQTIYTKITSILDWIQDNIHQNNYDIQDNKELEKEPLPDCAKRIWHQRKPCWDFCGHLYCP